MTGLTQVLFFALIGGVFSLLGGILLLSHKRIAKKLEDIAAPFAAGALLGAAFFDLLREGVEMADPSQVLNWTLGGILLFFLLERFLHWFHHHHEHKRSQNPAAVLVVIGDTIHNAIDGVAIGAAFLVGGPTGIITTLAVAAHEIPQEIGDFGLLLKYGYSRRSVVFINFMSALVTAATASLMFVLGKELPVGPVLGATAGFFIYIAASDIIPTIHQAAHRRFAKAETLLLLLGVAVVFATTTITHRYLPEESHIESESQTQLETFSEN